jgi:uncharacterized protein
LLAPDVDLKNLEKDQVVEGIVSNVTSFGAFVDLGTAKDAMIHISEISNHYVRDARVLLSVGQVVRARVVASHGPRAELSLKNVPVFRRAPPGRRFERGPHEEVVEDGREPTPERGERPGRRGPRRGRESGEAWPAGGRAARAGCAPAGAGRGAGRASGARGNGGRDEYDADAVRRASRPSGTYNPLHPLRELLQGPEVRRTRTTGRRAGRASARGSESLITPLRAADQYRSRYSSGSNSSNALPCPWFGNGGCG